MALSETEEKIMIERFGKERVISLATCRDNKPSVRGVDAVYRDGAFYIITYGLSNKMEELRANPYAAIAGEWFTAHGIAEELGRFGSPENREIADLLRDAFFAWKDKGNNNFDDENTIILKIKLTDAVLYSNGVRYELEF